MIERGAVEQWKALDAAWLAAFDLAWEAASTGNIGVGAVISDPDGTIVGTGRNRVADADAPVGQSAGSTIAHAELNALMQVPFRTPRELVLTTTLQPCLQCAAAIRMGPIASVRVAGRDPIWDDSQDFGKLNSWLARRGPVPTDGPRSDEVGLFATLVARFGPWHQDHVVEEVRRLGGGGVLDLAKELEDDGTFEQFCTRPVGELFAHVWPRLRLLRTER